MDFSKIRLHSSLAEETTTEAPAPGGEGEAPTLEWEDLRGEDLREASEEDPGGGEEVLNPWLEDEGDEEEGVEASAFDAQLGDLLEDFEGESSFVRLRTVDNFVPLPPAEAALLEARREERAARGVRRKQAVEAKRLQKHSKAKPLASRRGGVEASLGQRGPVEYLVDGRGRLVPPPRKGDGEAFARLVRAAENHAPVEVGDTSSLGDATVRVVADASLRGKVVYPWSLEREREQVALGGRGRLNEREADFFRNLGKAKSTVVEDESLLADLRAQDALPRSVKRVERGLAHVVALNGHEGFGKTVHRSLRETDLDYLRYLAKFKFASGKHLGRLNGVQEASAVKRLRLLAQKGLVERLNLWGVASTWMPTQAGMLVSGYDLPLVRPHAMSYGTVPHSFVVNHVAANLWGGQVNVLNLEGFPERRRGNAKGEEVFGETLVSETELQSSFARFKRMTSSDVYRPWVFKALEEGFSTWEAAGGSHAGLRSPEFEDGNEWMWVLFPPYTTNLNYHVPDLVVRRERARDGSPESLAVEIELDNKPKPRYRNTLAAYMSDNRLYKKVIWVCKSLATAQALEALAKDLGLWQEGKIDIVPIITEHGVFSDRDLWRI